MNITRDCAVTLQYKVSDDKGKLLDSGTLAYLHGGYDSIAPKVEAALAGQARGFAVTVDLAVDEAFGPRDEALARTIDKADFPPGVKVGGQLRGPDGRSYRVVKIKGPQVLLDANHPLAGMALRFAAKVLEVRPATAEEIAHRHIHGAHSHQH